MLLIALASVTQWGCQFLGGAATGALATGAGYEINKDRPARRRLQESANFTRGIQVSQATNRVRINPLLIRWHNIPSAGRRSRAAATDNVAEE